MKKCNLVFTIQNTGESSFESTYNTKDCPELKTLFQDLKQRKTGKNIYYSLGSMIANFMNNDCKFDFSFNRMFQGKINDGKINLWFSSRDLSNIIIACFTAYTPQDKIKIHTTEFILQSMKFDFDMENETIAVEIKPLQFPNGMKEITISGNLIW